MYEYIIMQPVHIHPHQYNINTLHFDLATFPCQNIGWTRLELHWNYRIYGLWIESIFSEFSERFISYSLHYYEAGQFAHLSIEWILVSLAGRAASPSPRTPRRTADRHRPCPPRRTSPPPAVDILDILWQIFLISTPPASRTPAQADASWHAETRTEIFR